MIGEVYEFMKKNVCHIVSGLKAGGVESMIYNYCKYLNDDYNFYLLYQHEASKKNIIEFEKLGFKLNRIPSKIKHPIKNFLLTYKFLKTNKIDIVHCHMTLMNIIPLLAAKLLNIKIRICHSHNSDVRKKNFAVKWLESLIKLICIKSSTHLVACGVDAGKYMFGSRKFYILNNALDLDLYKYNLYFRNKIRNKYNIHSDDILIGHIGRFTEQKNHELLIEIFEKIVNNSPKKKYKLILLGDGELRNEIEQLVLKKKLNEYVIFIGIVSNTNEFYSAFDLFLLPSLWEGFPVVSIESQISGLKCAYSKNIDINCKILETTCLIDNNDINKWVEFVLQSNNIYNRNCNEKLFNDKNLNIKSEVYKLKDIYEEEFR